MTKQEAETLEGCVIVLEMVASRRFPPGNNPSDTCELDADDMGWIETVKEDLEDLLDKYERK